MGRYCAALPRMKFVFCGGLDAPDWILTEIAVLSQITFIQMKRMVLQVSSELLGKGVDWDKVDKIAQKLEFNKSDVKAAFAAIRYIMSNAAKYDCEHGLLREELLQLGLPPELCDALCRTYKKHKDNLRLRLKKQTVRLPCLDKLDWRVDYVLSSSALKDVNTPTVSMKLDIGATSTSFEMTADKFLVLYQELKEARDQMGAFL